MLRGNKSDGSREGQAPPAASAPLKCVLRTRLGVLHVKEDKDSS